LQSISRQFAKLYMFLSSYFHFSRACFKLWFPKQLLLADNFSLKPVSSQTSLSLHVYSQPLLFPQNLTDVRLSEAFHILQCYVRPRVKDGGDGLQIWRVAANILNNQSRTVDKGLISPHWESSSCYGLLHSASDLDGPLERPRQRKINMIFGTRNVRNNHWADTLKAAASQLP